MPQPNLKNRILDSADQVLLESSYNGASVQDFTDAAKVPKGSFYNHFASKEAMVTEVVRRYGAAMLVDDQPRRQSSAVGQLREHLRRQFKRRGEERKVLGCMIGNLGAEVSVTSEPIRLEVVACLNNWATGIATMIAEGQREGDIPKTVDPVDMANFIVDAFEGAAMRAKATQDGAPCNRFLTMMFSQLLSD